jgi:DNA-binding NtrC family response regulator
VEKIKILVVDNDESLVNLLRLYLEAEDYEPLLATSAAEALELVLAGPPSLALIDRILDPPLRSAPLIARRPDHVDRKLDPPRRRRNEQGQDRSQHHVHPQVLDGLALARRLLRTYPLLPIILMTAHATIDSAWEAGQLGVRYITKPFDIRELARLIQKTLHEHRVQRRRILRTSQQNVKPKSSSAIFKELGRLKDYEHRYLVKMLTLTKGNIERAARLAGEARTTFAQLLKKHDINPNQFLDIKKEK